MLTKLPHPYSGYFCSYMVTMKVLILLLMVNQIDPKCLCFSLFLVWDEVWLVQNAILSVALNALSSCSMKSNIF